MRAVHSVRCRVEVSLGVADGLPRQKWPRPVAAVPNATAFIITGLRFDYCTPRDVERSDGPFFSSSRVDSAAQRMFVYSFVLLRASYMNVSATNEHNRSTDALGLMSVGVGGAVLTYSRGM